MTSTPPSSYRFVPLPDRRPLRFPGGARVAMIPTINVEYWEPFRPGQKEPLFPGGPATIPHVLPGDVWDTANWTWREYGQRIGIWRLIETFEEAGIAPSCTFNGLTAVERRRVFDAIVARGWELVPHNWAQNDLLTYYAGRPDEERAIITRTLETYKSITGKPAKAWLSSAIRGTQYTPMILKSLGVVAYCDYLNDDQPYMIDTSEGRIVCVPYSNDINDFNMFARGASSTREGIDMLKACFDQLYKEGEKTGRIMNFGLHPHVIGQPHRIAALAEFLAYVRSKEDVWFPTREELATWYMTVADDHIPPA